MKKTSLIQMTLNELGITSYEDYEKKVKYWESFDNRVYHGGQDKIDALRDLVVDYYDSYQYNQLSGQYISINPQNNPDNLISNYMCLFPKRALIETSALLSYIDMTPHNGESYDLPPNDFIKQYFNFQKIIDHNIAYLYPRNTNEERSHFTETIFDSSSIIPLKNVANVSRSGDFTSIVQNPKMFYMAFPWLYNAKTDDYLEICDKYPLEFDYLANAIEQIAKASNGEADLHSNVLYELNEALRNIQISYENKKSELKRKGIIATVGIVLTFVPYTLQNFFNNFDPSLLETIIGGASLISGGDLLNEFYSLRTEGNNNPYWVIWKWQKMSLSNQSKDLPC